MGVEERGDGRTVQLRGVRLAFTEALYEKKSVAGGEPKFNCTAILESDSKHYEANVAAIQRALTTACKNGLRSGDGNAYKTLMDDEYKRCSYREGRRSKNGEGSIRAGFEGNMFLSMSGPNGGTKRPVLLNSSKQPVEKADIMRVFYGGVYGDIIVSAYAVEGADKGGLGVFVSLDAIRSHQVGDPQGGGGISVEADDFDDLDDDDDFGTGDSSDADDDLM